MARFDNFHSRLVARAKIFLPMASLALLATLFLFSRGTETISEIPYARVEIESLAREQRLDGPTFATVTENGTQIEISAERARPDPSSPNVVNSTQVHAELKMPDHNVVSIRANDAVIDGQSRIAELSGDVMLNTTTGYALKTERIAAQLNFAKIESPGSVFGQTPSGNISAGSMEMSQMAEANDYVLVFKNRVKLIYQP